eukprot:scaffold855_cov344-Prasinococcus_capsulatus_cf.AAC.16
MRTRATPPLDGPERTRLSVEAYSGPPGSLPPERALLPGRVTTVSHCHCDPSSPRPLSPPYQTKADSKLEQRAELKDII